MWKFIFLVLVLLPICAFAQNRSNIWMIGYNYSETYPDMGFNFINDSLEMFILQRPMAFFFDDAGICDTAGIYFLDCKTEKWHLSIKIIKS